MVTKLQGYALGILLALTVTLSFGLWRSVSANGALRAERDTAVQALKQAAKQAKINEGILARLRTEKRSTGLQSATAAEAVKQASKAAPEWAGTSTPPDVQKALEGALEGLE